LDFVPAHDLTASSPAFVTTSLAGRGFTADSFEFDGKVWLYLLSREAHGTRNNLPQPRGFYYWEFREQSGRGQLALRKDQDEPFAVAFLDMRMPPGPDGVWAAARIRELDPAIEIVMCTAYSDIDPRDIGGLVPPEEKLSYLQKPFHPHEIRQMTISLASKWRSEHRIVRLAYFDALTGLPNRRFAIRFLGQQLDAARSSGSPVSVLFLDLDRLGAGLGETQVGFGVGAPVTLRELLKERPWEAAQSGFSK